MRNRHQPIFASEFNPQHHAGLAVASSAFRILACNTKFTLWIDQRIDSPIGMTLVELFPELVGFEDDLDQLVHGHSDALSISRIHRPPFDENINTQIHHLDRYFDLQIEPSLSFDNALTIIALDVTEEAHLEQRLRQECNELRLEKSARQRIEATLEKATQVLTTKVDSQADGLLLINAQLQAELADYKQRENIQEAHIDRLEKQNSELKRVNSTISQDLRGHIASVDTLLQSSQSSIEVGNAVQAMQNLTQAYRTTKNMERLVDGLLDLSSVDQLSFTRPIANEGTTDE